MESNNKMDQLIAEANHRKKEKGLDCALYAADYKFIDKEGKEQHLQFVYREPRESEMEMYASQAEKSQNGANRLLMDMLIVAPDSSKIMNTIGTHLTPISTFIRAYLNPLFGEVRDVQPIRRL